MSELVTVETLEAELVRLCGLLEEATGELKDKATDEARLESSYRKAKAVAYLSATGPVAERQAQVDKVCDEDRAKFYHARALKDAQTELLRSLRAQLDAWRTIAASHRAEADLAGRSVQKRNG
jgi:hypothetical protein